MRKNSGWRLLYVQGEPKWNNLKVSMLQLFWVATVKLIQRILEWNKIHIAYPENNTKFNFLRIKAVGLCH